MTHAILPWVATGWEIWSLGLAVTSGMAIVQGARAWPHLPKSSGLSLANAEVWLRAMFLVCGLKLTSSLSIE